jgi:transposase
LHTLAQSFGQIVRKREGHQLQDWIKQVEASSLRDVKRFAAGLQRDKEEVLAGLTLVYSNGQVEGQVNKLKLIKRMGYGRANFPLLRQRILHAMESFLSVRSGIRKQASAVSPKLCMNQVF